MIWLFGTIHLLPPDVRWREGPVARAIAQSDTLLTEIPDDDPHAQAAAFLKLGRVNGLPPLSARVPPAMQGALARAVAASGMPAAALDRMASWAAAVALTGGAARGLGATREDAPEAVLATAFAGRRRAAFETAAGQFGLFAALPEADQRLLLRAAIRGAADPAADYRRLLDAWRAGDPAALARAYDAAFADAPDLRTILVEQRNRAWADELKQYAETPGVLFVAVGAGHLIGPAGLPALLRERGFRVARVQ